MWLDLRDSGLLLAIATPLAGCCADEQCGNMHFDHFAAADQIVVTIGPIEVGAPITDAARIYALTAIIVAHGNGWSVRWAGPPIPRVNTQFYEAGRFLGDFGVGDSFASAQGCGCFQARDLSTDESATFAKQLGVSEAEVHPR